MLQQIISHTPIYVWALLAFLVYRGVLACRERAVTLRNLFIIPAVMLYLSLQDLAAKFGLDGLTMGLWLAGAAAGVTLAWSMMDASRIRVDRGAGTVIQPGSAVPLVLMLSVFLTKYAVAVLFAVVPDLRHNAMFMAAVCALFGLFNGVFLGRLLRYLAAWQREAGVVAA